MFIEVFDDDALIYDSGYQYLEKESALGKILEVIKQSLAQFPFADTD